MMSIVRFKIGETPITADYLGESTVKSPYSGKDLITLEVQFQAHESEQDFVNGLRSKGRGVVLSPDGDESKNVVVSVRQKSHSFSTNHRMQQFVWELTEVEELKIEALKLGDVTLLPYRYHERLDGKGIVITARVKVDAATDSAIRSLPDYFDVVREGISDEVKTMRFGRIVWSEKESEYKLGLTVVEKIIDDEKPGQKGGWFDPQFTNMGSMAAASAARMSKLLKVLKSKNLLTDEEVDSIGMVSEEDFKEQRLRLDEVDDLDEWLGDEKEAAEELG